MDEGNSTHHSKDQQNQDAGRLPRLGRRLLQPRIAAAVAVVAAVGLNASGAFGLNVLGLHSALTTTSLNASFQSAAIGSYGLITPTATTCSQVQGGNAGTLGGVSYSTKTGKTTTINQTNPGVFFYWVPVTSSGPSDVFTIVESVTNPPHTSTGLGFFAEASGTGVFTRPGCTTLQGPKITFGTTGSGATQTYTVTVTKVPAGAAWIGVKYSTSSVVGDTPPSNTSIPPGQANYSFNTYRNGGTTGLVASVSITLSSK